MLEEAFATAEENGVLLYDIMTERHEITTMLQKELSQIPEVFGELQTGTPEDPGHYQGKCAPLLQDRLRQTPGASALVFRCGTAGRRHRGCDHPPGGPGTVGSFSGNRPEEGGCGDHFRQTLDHRPDPGNVQKVTGLDSYPDYLSEGCGRKIC